ncbi:hypothetical protein N7478_008571 [Penicillium angulare]|uniref:uncharacterized protein n=1 Tax=Penicillium angulare TaxID=116970 RepID=UPI0025404BD2|nr:uncharacterized protein N7478_008571 [Penicillium angulare]KAJ5273446.1 hypothetical protein N7478_008571 [Penicillium angulare]
MAEKRKQPTRAGREPANKKRASEATTPQSKKKAATPKAPTPRVPTPPPPEPVEPPLPSKVNEGEPLPIRRARQPTNLSDNEYQSIAESAVLLLSLERSKKKWLSDGILVRFYTKPKKTKREQIEKMNPPKESMVKVGLCDVTVGPHLFDAMIYTVKDPTVPQPVQYASPQPQARMVHYGPGNNFQQHQPYQSNQQRRPPYTPAPPGRPQGYQGNYSPAPRGPHQQGPATPQSGQRPQSQNQPGQPAKPSPDPVIQMLATRAAADPELKALMRVVASSQASQEQLRAFQAHIDELNAIIKAREQQEKRQQASSTPTQQPQAVPQPATPASQNRPIPPANATPLKADTSAKPSQEQGSKSHPTVTIENPSKDQSAQPTGPAKPQSDGQSPSKNQPQTPAPAQQNQSSSTPQTSGPVVKQEPSANGPVSSQGTPIAPATSTPAVLSSTVNTPGPVTATQQKQSPALRPTPPANNVQQSTPRPGPPFPPYQQPAYGSQPPLQSRPPQYGSPTPYPRPQAPTTLAPTRLPYKSVVFEFTSPLTPYGSSTSGHAGSGDRYLFPEYSILEWIQSENTLLASFLIVRKVDPNIPFPIEIPSETGPSRGKGKGTSKSKKGDKKGKGKDAPDTPTPGQTETSTSTDVVPKTEPSDKFDKLSAQPGTPGTPGTPSEPPAKEANLKEYWQPVTFRIHASDARVLDPLRRVIKPPDEVRKYMNEIMDRAERAPDGFPALRLPTEDAREAFEAESTPASTINANASRNRAARGSTTKIEVESEVENNPLEIEEEEEELLEFYGAPLGLAPIGA